MLKKRLLVPILLIGAGMLLMGLYSVAGTAEVQQQPSDTSNIQVSQGQEDIVPAVEQEEGQEAEDGTEADENLSGGGHQDQDGVDVDHEFEGVE